MKWCRLLIFVILLVLPGQALADIYMYIDSGGVVHFTNVPTSSDYKLYIRELPEGRNNLQRSSSFNRRNTSQDTGRFDSEISMAAEKFGLEPSLVKAVIEVESAFDPHAVSRKGAKGLMQIMPDNYTSLGISDPFDPYQNIMGGTLYLKQLFNRYSGKLPLVLAAYNAGPSAVDRYKAIPPFNETRRYVRKVMQRYSLYNSSF
ncbi:MAG: transglycosylase SLT domain-containing protein [Thermodesulfobacteriota bacterium]|nr:transglycosylase SLT domain-containing protein [Thermodesulfobacteriota bacterium]